MWCLRWTECVCVCAPPVCFVFDVFVSRQLIRARHGRMKQLSVHSCDFVAGSSHSSLVVHRNTEATPAVARSIHRFGLPFAAISPFSVPFHSCLVFVSPSLYSPLLLGSSLVSLHCWSLLLNTSLCTRSPSRSHTRIYATAYWRTSATENRTDTKHTTTQSIEEENTLEARVYLAAASFRPSFLFFFSLCTSVCAVCVCLHSLSLRAGNSCGTHRAVLQHGQASRLYAFRFTQVHSQEGRLQGLNSRHCIGKRNTRLYPALPIRKSRWLVAVVLRLPRPLLLRFLCRTLVDFSVCGEGRPCAAVFHLFVCCCCRALHCRVWSWSLRTSWSTIGQTPERERELLLFDRIVQPVPAITDARAKTGNHAGFRVARLHSCVLRLVLLTACPGRVILTCSPSRCFHYR